ncbi:hypothetical protein BJY04DRAFT_216764 [Aspergillus karnatakaensis]|uniref:uncharacterized protein n=1 Tax=Aspergillus karnatakaensis TaxID=1810916 RepID=UPI003CCD8442
MSSLLRGQTANGFRQSVFQFTQKRSWSARTIPSFYPTASPELDKALNRFRDEVFVPHSLNTEQKRMIYKQRFADKLRENPITVSIGPKDEPYLLRPIDVEALPSRQDAYAALYLMFEAKNWSNLPLFLTGLYNANRKISRTRWEWLIRKAGQSNGLGALLQCAQTPKETHFWLKDTEIVKKLFLQLHLLALEGVSSEPDVEKAHRLATQFALQMETDAHAVNSLEKDPRKSPFVIGALLELNAAYALQEPSKEQGAEVLKFAQRFLASWEPPVQPSADAKWALIDELLQEIVMSYNGMLLALRVPEISKAQDVSKGLRERVAEYGTFIKKLKKMAPAKVVENPTLGFKQATLLHKE